MIKSEQSGDRLVGTYRGIVLKHLPHGKCKIYIPSIHDPKFKNDPDSLPTAQPKTPLFAGTNEGNGVFSYPNLSSIVWCTFMNGDANFPVFDSATLGGEDAFGQYELIKGKGEPVSTKHMVTSGKTHMLWYEKGILSGIVEDPIRTQCSVDYDQFEKEVNNTSVESPYSYEITNDILRKIKANEISNINCQYVLDNDGAAHGVLSTSTHWYSIVDDESKDKLQTAKGTISTDNHNVMDNNGTIDIGTLSTCQLFSTDKAVGSTDNSKERVQTSLRMAVPGAYDQQLQWTSTSTALSPAKAEKIELSSSTAMHRDVSADTTVFSHKELKQSVQDILNERTVNLTSDLQNSFFMKDPGDLNLSSELHEKTLSADKRMSSTCAKDNNVSSVIGADSNAESRILNLSSLNLVQTGPIDNIVSKVDLSNSYEAKGEGTVTIETRKVELTTRASASGSEIIKSDGKSLTLHNVGGDHASKGENYLFQSKSGSTVEVTNKAEVAMKNKQDSSLSLKSSEVKKVNGSPTIDAQYSYEIDASTSTADIKVIDNIAKKECVSNMDAKRGMTEIRITSLATGLHCTIKMDALGNMSIDTASSIALTAPAITAKSDFMSIDTKDLSIKSLARCSIDSKNTTFSGKVSVGAGATGTLNSASIASVVNGIVTEIK